ncbi:MAG: LysR family transcriptional regulator [Burkholderiales bacterium]
MEIYQLRSFVTVAEQGQLTRAAEALHVSQPAITAQIKALEDDLGVVLFERISSGMLLTRAGERLMGRAEKILALSLELKNEAKAMSGEVTGKISLGTVSDPDFIRLGEVLNAMVERFPLVELDLHQRVTGEAFDEVRNGTLDASFYFGEMNSPQVSGLHLCDIVYCVAAPAAWKDRVASADWAEIAALPWIFAPAVSTHNQLLHELFRNHGAEPTKVVEADQESVINSLIGSGVGISLMRDDHARAGEAAGEIYIWEKEKLTTSLWFIFAADHAHDAAIVSMVDAVRNAWALKPAAETRRNSARQTADV